MHLLSPVQGKWMKPEWVPVPRPPVLLGEDQSPVLCFFPLCPWAPSFPGLPPPPGAQCLQSFLLPHLSGPPLSAFPGAPMKRRDAGIKKKTQKGQKPAKPGRSTKEIVPAPVLRQAGVGGDRELVANTAWEDRVGEIQVGH